MIDNGLRPNPPKEHWQGLGTDSPFRYIADTRFIDSLSPPVPSGGLFVYNEFLQQYRFTRFKDHAPEVTA